MEFVVNKYITLRLENNKTVMYVNDEKHNLCCAVLSNVLGDHPRFSIKNHDSLDRIIDSGQFKSTANQEIKTQISPEEEFWAYCSNLQAWVENKYNTTLLVYDASIPLLHKLREVGDPLAKAVYKKEILRRLKFGSYWAFMLIKTEGYFKTANITEEELIEGVLVSTEADALKKISKTKDLKYVICGNFDDDEVRERPLYQNLLTPELFFTVRNGHIIELEIELTKKHPNIPVELGTFKHLKNLHIWITDPNIIIPQPSFKVESVSRVKLIMHKSVWFPQFLNLIFPNLKNQRVYETTKYQKLRRI